MSDETPPEQQGPQLNPQTGYPVGQQPAYPQAPPPQSAPPPGYQAPGYQAPYAPYAPYQAAGPAGPTDLPKATAAMVVGIVALAGAVFCVLPILGAPVAWVLGVQARGQIRRAPHLWSGEGKATAGMVLGIVGTVVLVLGLVALVIVVVLLVNDTSFSSSDTGV